MAVSLETVNRPLRSAYIFYWCCKTHPKLRPLLLDHIEQLDVGGLFFVRQQRIEYREDESIDFCEYGHHLLEKRGCDSKGTVDEYLSISIRLLHVPIAAEYQNASAVGYERSAVSLCRVDEQKRLL